MGENPSPGMSRVFKFEKLVSRHPHGAYLETISGPKLSKQVQQKVASNIVAAKLQTESALKGVERQMRAVRSNDFNKQYSHAIPEKKGNF